MQRVGPQGHGGQGDADAAKVYDACPAFRDTADPSGYVPREASERALEQLETAMRSRSAVVALTGPPGLGKTLLLRVLEQRHRKDARPVYLPYASLTLDELSAWALGLLGRAPRRDPVAVLQDVARDAVAGMGPLVLLIDEANSMPLDTARALGECVEACGGDLSLVLAAPDDARTSRVVAALGVDAAECRYDQPMSEDETQRHVVERLRAAGADPIVWRRLGREVVRRLHGLSGGNPRRLHVLASEVIRGEPGRRVLRQIEPTWSDLLADAEALDTDDGDAEGFAGGGLGTWTG